MWYQDVIQRWTFISLSQRACFSGRFIGLGNNLFSHFSLYYSTYCEFTSYCKLMLRRYIKQLLYYLLLIYYIQSSGIVLYPFEFILHRVPWILLYKYLNYFWIFPPAIEFLWIFSAKLSHLVYYHSKIYPYLRYNNLKKIMCIS